MTLQMTETRTIQTVKHLLVRRGPEHRATRRLRSLQQQLSSHPGKPLRQPVLYQQSRHPSRILLLRYLQRMAQLLKRLQQGR